VRKPSPTCLCWDCFTALAPGCIWGGPPGARGVAQRLGDFVAPAVPPPMKQRESYLVIAFALYSGKSGFLFKKKKVFPVAFVSGMPVQIQSLFPALQKVCC